MAKPDDKAAANAGNGGDGSRRPKTRRKKEKVDPNSGKAQVIALNNFAFFRGIPGARPPREGTAGLKVSETGGGTWCTASDVAKALRIYRLVGHSPIYYAPAMEAGETIETLSECTKWKVVEPKEGEDVRVAPWREMSDGDISRYLKLNGVATRPLDDERISQKDLILEYVQSHRIVYSAGPLAGYQPGVHYSRDGKPFIVLDGPRLFEPKEGDWSLIENVLTSRLRNDEGPQLDLFKLWLKRGIEPLYHGRQRKGPILILVGANDSGKTFLQRCIITPAMGGRTFNPSDYFKSEQGFNKGMMGAEHLAMSEFPFAPDGASRLMLSEKLKQIAANDEHTYHPKGRDAWTACPHWRLSISLNDNAEKLRSLPPLGSDFADKVVLLKVDGTSPMPMPTNTDEEEAAFAEAIYREIPAFVHNLLNWVPPPELAQGRFGMTTWQNPEVAELLWEQEPANRFAVLLDRHLFPAAEPPARASHKPWGWGTAVDLHEELCAPDAAHSTQFRGLLAKFEGACAQLLGMLHRREAGEMARRRGVPTKAIEHEDPERRYKWKHGKQANFWMIEPPGHCVK